MQLLPRQSDLYFTTAICSSARVLGFDGLPSPGGLDACGGGRAASTATANQGRHSECYRAQHAATQVHAGECWGKEQMRGALAVGVLEMHLLLRLVERLYPYEQLMYGNFAGIQTSKQLFALSSS